MAGYAGDVVSGTPPLHDPRHPGALPAVLASHDIAITIALSILALALFAGVIWTDRPLTEAGYSMVNLQLAGTATMAGQILDTWRAAGVIDAAALNQRADYVFMLVYPPALSMTCHTLGARLPVPSGTWLCRAVLLCAPLDATENLAIQHMLDQGAGPLASCVAAACALPKFMLAGAALTWCALGLVRLSRSEARTCTRRE